MGLLHGTRTYLAGPIEYDENCLNWRIEMRQFCDELGIKWYDPLHKPDWYPSTAKDNPKVYIDALKGEAPGFSQEDAFKATQFLVDVDLRYVHSCDFLIACLPRGKCTYGTIDEILVAAAAKKPIFVFGPGKVASSWMVPRLCTQEDFDETFFESAEDVRNYLRRVNNNEIELDPLKWIFFSYFNKEVKLKCAT